MLITVYLRLMVTLFHKIQKLSPLWLHFFPLLCAMLETQQYNFMITVLCSCLLYQLGERKNTFIPSFNNYLHYFLLLVLFACLDLIYHWCSFQYEKILLVFFFSNRLSQSLFIWEYLYLAFIFERQLCWMQNSWLIVILFEYVISLPCLYLS